MIMYGTRTWLACSTRKASSAGPVRSAAGVVTPEARIIAEPNSGPIMVPTELNAW